MACALTRFTVNSAGMAAWISPVKRAQTVIAVASGVVTWSGKRSGYGDMVEINHGDGFITRYGHNDENLVTLGSMSKKVSRLPAWAVPVVPLAPMFTSKYTKTVALSIRQAISTRPTANSPAYSVRPLPMA